VLGRGGEALGRARRSLTSGCPLARDCPLGRARREPWLETGRQVAWASGITEVALVNLLVQGPGSTSFALMLSLARCGIS
jgi:hypothetical protein